MLKLVFLMKLVYKGCGKQGLQRRRNKMGVVREKFKTMFGPN